MSNAFDPGGPKTVPVSQAAEEAAYWREIIGPFMNGNPLRGFFIPIADLNAIAAMHQVSGMRAYFCLTTREDFRTVSLVVVPVDDDNNDITSIADNVGGEVSTIYDLTSPCPAFCDPHSIMYGSST
jgi:hypothetical protein